MIRIPKEWCRYTPMPDNPLAYTKKMNRMYTRFAKAYERFIVIYKPWKKWLETVLPYVHGNRILEVSFGPGYLLTKYPADKKLYGIDYNSLMVHRAKIKIVKARRKAKLIIGNVEKMPYPDNFFDTVINTMAFSGYPDGQKAMSEMLRVIKPSGRLILLDYDYPMDRNVLGFALVRFIEMCGDIIKDIPKLIKDNHASYDKIIVGGFGSIQLFIIKK